MSSGTKHMLIAVLLIGLPFLIVKGVKGKQGTFSDIPKARQKGDTNAKVLIVEYSNFRCPACAKAQSTLRRLMKKYEGKIKVAFRHFPPKKTHKHGGIVHDQMIAHHAAECAADQDQFWPFHDRLFDHQKTWRKLGDPTPRLKTFAADLQLDMERFNKCLANSSKRIPIELDIAEGKKRKVKSTPTFFVGDKRMVGRVFRAEGSRAIEEALRR